MLSLKGFSQTATPTKEIDSTKVVLSVKTARLVYQDLLRYDGLKQEMSLVKFKLQKFEERDAQKDTLITILTKKDENNQFIMGMKDEQFQVSKQLTDALYKELKGQRTDTFLWKVGAFIGLGLTTSLLINN